MTGHHEEEGPSKEVMVRPDLEWQAGSHCTEQNSGGERCSRQRAKDKKDAIGGTLDHPRTRGGLSLALWEKSEG